MKKASILLLLIVASGCSKDNSVQKFIEDLLSSQRNQLPSEIQILELLQLPTDGYASITSYATLSTQPFRGPEIMIRGFGYSKEGLSSDFGPLAFSSIITNTISETNFDYLTIGAPGSKDLYGTITPISLAGKNGLPGFNTNFYVPKMMTITSPSFSNNSVISQGTTISWEADSNNTFGVGIAIHYNPNAFENYGLNQSGSTVTNLVRVEDTGNYTITANNLAGIPVNAELTLRIGRGNYQRVSMPNDYHFGLIAYSIIAHPFIRQ
ncbi:MAG: hypothetical protein Q7T20_00465 [Saprospiraceae bacterium]|nr:hypothetical protein [Saprospiraceae bacterium]